MANLWVLLIPLWRIEEPEDASELPNKQFDNQQSARGAST
jgi:hypothetical protein